MAIEIEKYIGDSELSEEPKKKIGFKLNRGSVKMEHLSEGVISNMIRVFKPYIDEAISGYVETDPTVQPWAKNIIWAGGQPYGTNIQNPYNTLWFDHIFGVNVTGNQHAIGLKVEGNSVSNSDFITKIIAESSGDYAIHDADDRSLLTANVISSLINETVESSGAYILPETGIPFTDLDSTVQQALQMASTAAPMTYVNNSFYKKTETYSKIETDNLYKRTVRNLVDSSSALDYYTVIKAGNNSSNTSNITLSPNSVISISSRNANISVDDDGINLNAGGSSSNAKVLYNGHEIATVDDRPNIMLMSIGSGNVLTFYDELTRTAITPSQVILNIKSGVPIGQVVDSPNAMDWFVEGRERLVYSLIGSEKLQSNLEYYLLSSIGTTVIYYIRILSDIDNDSLSLSRIWTEYYNNYQPVISDLATIRSGAAAGATANQKITDGLTYNDLASSVQASLNKANNAVLTETDPTVPQHVKAITAANIVDWNAKGTYTKPVSGIPLSDLDNGVKSSLAKADEAVQPADIEDFLTENDVVPVEFQDENKVKIATIAGQDIWAPAEVEAASVDIPVASSDTLGGIKIGYSTTDNSNNRAVQLSNQKAYVRVPDATTTTRGLMVAADKELLSDLDDSRLLEKYAYETWLTSTPGNYVCTVNIPSGELDAHKADYFGYNIMNITYTTEYGVQKNILDAIINESRKKPFRIFRFVFGHTDNTADVSYLAVRLYHQEYNTGTKDGVDNALLDVTYETYLIEGNVKISGSGNNVVVAVNPSFENNTINRYSMTVTYYRGEVYTITYNDLTSEKIIDDVAVLKSKDFVTKADYDILADQLAALTQNTTSEAVVTTETSAVKVKLVTLKDFEEETPITDYPRMIGVNQDQFVVNQIYPEKHSQFNYINVNYSGQAQFLIPTAQELTGHIDYDQTKLQYYDGVGYVVTPVDGAYLTIGNSLDPTTNKMPAGSYRYIFTDISNSSRQLAYRTCYVEDEISSTKVIILPNTAGSADINIDNLPKYWESYPSDWSNKRSGFVINEVSDDTWFDFKTYTQAQIATASNGMLTDLYSFHSNSISTTFHCVYTANASDKYRYTYITTDDFIGLILIQRPT